MKTHLIIAVIIIFLVGCKSHPWLAVNPLQDGEVGIVKYRVYYSKKDRERQQKEAIDLITKYCQNYKLIKSYESTSQSGTSISPNGYGGYNSYNTTTRYFNIEFKCGGTSNEKANNEDYLKYGESGNENLNKKNYSQALADFNKVIELKPDYAIGYYDRGRTKSALGDFNGEIEDCNKAIELNPNFSMAYNNRGWAKFRQKNHIEALKDFNKAIELDSKNWVAYDSRQETKFALNDFDGCLEDCNIAIELNPKLANSYLFRGKVYLKKDDKKKACENWSKAGQYGIMEAYELIKQNCN